MPIRAIIFDFNGTLSNDEPLLCGIFSEPFAEYGRPLSEQEYYERLAGLSERRDRDRWLGRPTHGIPAVTERIDRYRRLVADGSTVTEHADAVRFAAAVRPVAIVSGAALDEIEPVVAAAGLA